jgi:dipeptidyl aminopeptidase/acylaminoacyl peptidase
MGRNSRKRDTVIFSTSWPESTGQSRKLRRSRAARHYRLELRRIHDHVGRDQTNRFGAAVAGAASNHLSYYGENKIDQWMIPYFGATVTTTRSPAKVAYKFIKKAKTPTLIVVGDRDGECPVSQSYEFWHALKTLKVPTELSSIQRRSPFRKPRHSRDVIDRTAAQAPQYLTAK